MRTKSLKSRDQSEKIKQFPKNTSWIGKQTCWNGEKWIDLITLLITRKDNVAQNLLFMRVSGYAKWFESHVLRHTRRKWAITSVFVYLHGSSSHINRSFGMQPKIPYITSGVPHCIKKAQAELEDMYWKIDTKKRKTAANFVDESRENVLYYKWCILDTYHKLFRHQTILV